MNSADQVFPFMYPPLAASVAPLAVFGPAPMMLARRDQLG